jgi:hypothetical protein
MRQVRLQLSRGRRLLPLSHRIALHRIVCGPFILVAKTSGPCSCRYQTSDIREFAARHPRSPCCVARWDCAGTVLELELELELELGHRRSRELKTVLVSSQLAIPPAGRLILHPSFCQDGRPHRY